MNLFYDNLKGMTKTSIFMLFCSQKDDGLPVHLKRGAVDKALYYTIWGLIGVGLVGSAEFFYSLP